MKTETPVLPLAGLSRFLALRSGAIATVCDRFADQKTLRSQFGPRGRSACREQIGDHLEFFRPVLEFGITQPMLDYLRWLASVQTNRGLPATHIAEALDWLGEFFEGRMDPEHADIVVNALRTTKEQFLTQADTVTASHPHLPERWPECDEFESELLAGNWHTSLSLLERWLGEGRSLIDFELHIIQPAMYSIGQKWQENKVSVAKEHLATAIAQDVMIHGLARSEVPAANGRRILLACVAHNNHSVGLQMIADAYRLAGWEVRFLGADVPAAEVVRHVGEFRPDLLGLSVSLAQQFHTVREIVSQLRQVHGVDRPAVIVGGLAINQYDQLVDELEAQAWSADAGAAPAAGSRIILGSGV